jgi:hypothetical protein
MTLLLIPVSVVIGLMLHAANKSYKTVEIQGVGKYRVHANIHAILEQQAEMLAGYQRGFEKIEKKQVRQTARKGLYVSHRK